MAAQNPFSKASSDRRISIGAFGISLIAHFVVLLLAGSIVIFKEVIPKTPFEAVNIASTYPEENLEMFPEPEEAGGPELPSLDPSLDTIATSETPTTDATSSDILVSTATQQLFSLPPAVGTPTATLSLGSGQAGLPGANQAGSGGGGGGGKGPIRSLSSIFGNKGDDRAMLRGTLYDLKQDRRGKPTPIRGGNAQDNNAPENREYDKVVRAFVQNWDLKVLEDYYKASVTLTTSQILIPVISAEEAPRAFEVDKEVQPMRWLIHYEGQFIAPRDGTFRFVGYADDNMLVRFNRQLVLNGSLASVQGIPPTVRQDVGHRLNAGAWFTMRRGETYPLQILLGERPGGRFFAYLFIQDQAEAQNQTGKMPPLPVFQVVPTRLPEWTPEMKIPAWTNQPFAGLEP